MPDEPNPGIEIAKALIGTGVNLAIPGMGSLVALGFQRAAQTDAAMGDEVAEELLGALQATKPRPLPPRRKWRERKRAEKREDEAATALLGGSGFAGLMESATKTYDDISVQSEAAPASAENGAWSALGEAQLAMAASPGLVPGAWQDEFAALLQVSAGEGLKDETRRPSWRALIGVADGDNDPGPDVLLAWSRSVTRIFAARMEGNSKLRPLAKNLHRNDREAMRRAVLWQMDRQRQSLQLIAGAICAVLTALGIEAGVLQ